jgi:sarcosine oxidase subunit beta
MRRFSLLSLLKEAANAHQGWDRQWRSPEPKVGYDAVIVGGGGHGLATAYYMAKEHGMRNIAVLEKGWLGGGNTGRNTTIIRSNYLYDESAELQASRLCQPSQRHRQRMAERGRSQGILPAP